MGVSDSNLPDTCLNRSLGWLACTGLARRARSLHTHALPQVLRTNFERMGVDAAAIEAVVLSHWWVAWGPSSREACCRMSAALPPDGQLHARASLTWVHTQRVLLLLPLPAVPLMCCVAPLPMPLPPAARASHRRRACLVACCRPAALSREARLPDATASCKAGAKPLDLSMLCRHMDHSGGLPAAAQMIAKAHTATAWASVRACATGGLHFISRHSSPTSRSLEKWVCIATLALHAVPACFTNHTPAGVCVLQTGRRPPL